MPPNRIAVFVRYKLTAKLGYDLNLVPSSEHPDLASERDDFSKPWLQPSTRGHPKCVQRGKIGVFALKAWCHSYLDDSPAEFHLFVHLAAVLLCSLLPDSQIVIMSTDTYPNWVFSMFAFFGFVISMIPLPWHLEGIYLTDLRHYTLLT